MEPTNELWEMRNFYNAVTNISSKWHLELRRKFSLHPAVERMLKYKPADPAKLVLEWPHISETDTMRLAYTRSPADGENNRQLVTSIGKYLSRHWPSVSDHLRRDAQALYTPDTMYFVHTLPEIIMGVELGPHSCMCSASGGLEFTSKHHNQMLAWIADNVQPEPPWNSHPYNAYAPDLGWHMALRKDNTGKIMARAMCNKKMFVRTYRRGNDMDAYSHTDEVLAAWLQEQGYTHKNSWPDGTKLRCEDLQCPYIDGDTQKISHLEGDIYAVDTHGDHDATNTNGYAESRNSNDDDDGEDYRECEECGDNNPVSDVYYVGRAEDKCVCENCRDNNFIGVRGARSRGRGWFEYYIRNDDACSVANRDYYIDPCWLPEGIVAVQSDNAPFAEVDDTICIDGDCWLVNSDNIVALHVPNPDNEDDYAHENNTWTCATTGYIYHDNTQAVVIDGNTYHPDDVPKTTITPKPRTKVVRDAMTFPLNEATQ